LLAAGAATRLRTRRTRAGGLLAFEARGGEIMRPHKGSWGNDKMMHMPSAKGFWIKDTGTATWVPSPVGYSAPAKTVK
jgi:hypothetical protein